MDALLRGMGSDDPMAGIGERIVRVTILEKMGRILGTSKST